MHSVRLPAVLILLALSGLLGGATLEHLSLDDMIAKSTDIVRGRISYSQATPHGSVIYSHYRVDVTERWKGVAAGAMDIVVPGGTTGNLRQTFSGAPKLVNGSEYVLFLWRGPSGLTHVIGLSQGIFDLKTDSTGSLIASRTASTELMFDANGQAVRGETLKMRVLDLKLRVNSVLARGMRR